MERYVPQNISYMDDLSQFFLDQLNLVPSNGVRFIDVRGPRRRAGVRLMVNMNDPYFAQESMDRAGMESVDRIWTDS